MPFRYWFASVWAVVLLGGCVTTAPPLSSVEEARIEYGAPPQAHEKAIRDYFAKSLFEPEAARYRFGQPFRGYIQAGPLLGGKVQEAGYIVEVWLTAKNQAGGSLPERHLGVLIKNGEVVLELTEGELGEVRRPR